MTSEGKVFALNAMVEISLFKESENFPEKLVEGFICILMEALSE